jgi:hypothetical protein
MEMYEPSLKCACIHPPSVLPGYPHILCLRISISKNDIAKNECLLLLSFLLSKT